MRDAATIIRPEIGKDAPSSGKASVTTIILTFNEAVHIERCISRIAPLAERIIVVDSFSTDRTVEIAKRLGAEVIQRPFKHQADQFQWALDACAIRTAWVLRLDADEYFEDPAIAEIRQRLPTLPPEVTGIDFKRKFYFMGRWIRHGGYYPTVLTRLWRTGVGSIEQRWMDEHVVLSRGHSLLLCRGDLVDENLGGVGAWMDKHNRYATRQMVDFINREYHLFPVDERLERGHSRARYKRFLRNRIFGRAPLFARSVLYFLYRYLVRLGFLDGREGFVFHTLHALCFFILIDAKIFEARRFIRTHGLGAFRERLRTRERIEV